MSDFKYLGELPRPGLVVAYGPMTEIKLPKKDGTVQVLTPISPAVTFPVGEPLGYDITDERSLRIMRTDERFEEIP